MAACKSAGLGGIVCNVDVSQCMTSEAHWSTLVRAVDACRQAGLVVWIYDEDGYPSAAAGGLVLKENPSFEALALVYDRSAPKPFALRRIYEYSHASNNFYAARRYPNLIDDGAMACFVDKTHEAYRRRIGPHLGKTVRAFFTDEPSLIAVDLGKLPEDVRKRVRVVDPIDEQHVRPLPGVPWCSDVEVQYRQRYGEDLAPLRRSLFEGNAEADRRTRRRFWSLIADLVSERYFGRIQDWCRARGVASSGHLLWEESIIHHVPLYGNALKALGRMDIPGMDMLSSDPGVVLHSGWLTALLPGSAALLSGGRRVMTEVSDFSQRMAKQGPTSLEQMQATAAWQAALGVTEFCSYYGSLRRIVTSAGTDNGAPDRDKSRAYCDYVGRLNAVLRDARPNPNVLLYYPIYDLWAEYVPVAGPLSLQSQSKRAQRIVESFLKLGQRLLAGQVSFALVDHELLSQCEVCDGQVRISGHLFDAIVLPDSVELPERAAEVVKRLAASGGAVMRDGDSSGQLDVARLTKRQALAGLEPGCGHVVLGRFVRDGRDVGLLINVGADAYTGRARIRGKTPWLRADPASGSVAPCEVGADGMVKVSLAKYAAILMTGPSASEAARK